MGENKFYLSFALFCFALIIISIFVGNKTGELCKNNMRVYEEGAGEASQDIFIAGNGTGKNPNCPKPICPKVTCPSSDAAPPASTAASGKTTKRKILYAIFASVQPDRALITKQSLEVLYQDKAKWGNKYQVDCLLLFHSTWKEMQPAFDSLGFPECKKLSLLGAKYVDKLYHLSPPLLEAAGYEYVTLLMDDIRMQAPLGKFDLEHYYDLLFHYNFAAATPGIENTYFAPIAKNTPRAGVAGRKVEYIEVQHATYRIDAFACYWDMADPRTPHGWESAWFFKYCLTNGKVKNPTQAVIQTMYAKHVPNVTPPVPGFDPMKLYTAQIENYKAERGVLLEPNNVVPPSDNSEIMDI